MSRKERIEEKLAALAPAVLEVIDESNRHKGGNESHYNVVLVSAAFDGELRVARHRQVHELLADELRAGLHALTLTLRTPAEHAAANAEAIQSPSCAGSPKG